MTAARIATIATAALTIGLVAAPANAGWIWGGKGGSGGHSSSSSSSTTSGGTTTGGTTTGGTTTGGYSSTGGGTTTGGTTTTSGGTTTSSGSTTSSGGSSSGGTAVPEPADFALFGLGVAGLVIGRFSARKRRTRQDRDAA